MNNFDATSQIWTNLIEKKFIHFDEKPWREHLIQILRMFAKLLLKGKKFFTKISLSITNELKWKQQEIQKNCQKTKRRELKKIKKTTSTFDIDLSLQEKKKQKGKLRSPGLKNQTAVNQNSKSNIENSVQQKKNKNNAT